MEECLGNDCPKKKTVHLTEIIDGQMTEMHLCEDCPKLKKVNVDQQFGLAGLLADFGELAASSLEPAEAVGKPVLQCTHCGLEYNEFRKCGRLGCAHCYESFKKPISVLLKNIHGSDKHRGKAPTKIVRNYSVKEVVEKQPAPKPTKEDLLQGLQQQLEQAIDKQDFEQAALLRDQIKDLKHKESL